ncbi:uncharacterized protein LOC122084402 [Macadamia integrifolia]|uniref:uncharacterized protein LOC122084402 n=1 Tax=Macadamia integrifolia TaxID=60698 RepID=UPI001C4FC899|nr:uncharacterized protein LOC122084402 [Macadamia integrifolia]
MSVARQAKNKKRKEQNEVLTWQQKKMIMDEEEELIKREVEELNTWANMIEAMDDNQLREYIKNRPEDMQTSTAKTGKVAPTKRVRKSTGKPKGSTYSRGLLAVVMKYHKEEDDEEAPKKKN